MTPPSGLRRGILECQSGGLWDASDDRAAAVQYRVRRYHTSLSRASSDVTRYRALATPTCGQVRARAGLWRDTIGAKRLTGAHSRSRRPTLGEDGVVVWGKERCNVPASSAKPVAEKGPALCRARRFHVYANDVRYTRQKAALDGRSAILRPMNAPPFLKESCDGLRCPVFSPDGELRKRLSWQLGHRRRFCNAI